VFVGRIAAPQALNQSGGWLPPSDHVFLPLLLLNFESETRAQDALQQFEK
jgi:hypothetical protein